MGFACFSHSHQAHSLRRPPSLTQKIIQIFCLVLNADCIQHKLFVHFESHLEKRKGVWQPLFFLLERVMGFACFSHSHQAHSLRRPPSLTQKIIQIFCLVLNADCIQHKLFVHFESHLEKRKGVWQPLFFLLERVMGFACFSHSHQAHSLRRPPSLTQKIIQIFCLVLNADCIQHKLFVHFESHLEKRKGVWQPLFFLLERVMGFACFSHSHQAHSLRRPPSLTQKIIQIFCLVLNAYCIQHKLFVHFESHLEKRKGVWQPLFFLLERVMGFEPTASTLARLHSSQLSYTRITSNKKVHNRKKSL